MNAPDRRRKQVGPTIQKRMSFRKLALVTAGPGQPTGGHLPFGRTPAFASATLTPVISI